MVVHERLYRSRTDRVLFGVAGGFAEWLDVDPALVRLVWALLVVAGGAGLLLYIIAALVIPEEPWELSANGPAATTGEVTAVDPTTATGSADSTSGVTAPTGSTPAGMSRAQARQVRRAARQAARGPGDGTGLLIFGVILVAAGALFLVRDLLPAFDDRFVGPVFLIAIGVLLVVGAMRRQGGGRPG